MAGEYYRWLAKDVKPEQKKELTREEKIRNWWHYHKWHLLIAVAALFLAADILGDVWSNYVNSPDYSIAYVGSGYLPEDTVEQLTEALEALGEDLNGRGGVQVALNQYIVYPADAGDSASAVDNSLYYAQVRLAADLESGDSFIFLMEDPEQFQEDYQVLALRDGALTADAQPLYYAWSDCPVLRELPLGSYQLDTFSEVYTGASQDILAGLYIGRLAGWDGGDSDLAAGWEAFWNDLIRGAAG